MNDPKLIDDIRKAPNDALFLMDAMSMFPSKVASLYSQCIPPHLSSDQIEIPNQNGPERASNCIRRIAIMFVSYLHIEILAKVYWPGWNVGYCSNSPLVRP